MAGSLNELLELLDLDELSPDRFRGQSPKTRLQRTFGGQVAGQALMAAGRTVAPDRGVHSLHAYFLRPGLPATPIDYEVERVREGRSFNTRRVLASQGDRVIFVMSANFQIAETGFEHQDPMPVAPQPESIPTMADRAVADPTGWGALWKEWAAIDVRPVGDVGFGVVPGVAHPAHSQVWLRAAGSLPDNAWLHACVFTYASDMTLLGAAVSPHARDFSKVQMASLDHAMWFHRPFRADEWMLHDQVSPSASGGRGLAAGRLFTRDGVLVASVMQEGVVRPLSTQTTP